MTSRVHLLVSGTVQGVGFRWATREEATRLGLTGWVRNLEDGRVEAIAEGPREVLEQLVVWAHRGPPSSRVTDVAVTWSEPTGEWIRFSVQR